jgi:hypothetical protein
MVVVLAVAAGLLSSMGLCYWLACLDDKIDERRRRWRSEIDL